MQIDEEANRVEVQATYLRYLVNVYDHSTNTVNCSSLYHVLLN